MSENLNSLIRKRGVVKAKLTRLHTHLNSIDELDIDDLEFRKTKLQEHNQLFLNYQSLIEDLSAGDDDIERAVEEQSAFDETFVKCLKIINKGIRELSIASNSTREASVNSPNLIPVTRSNSFLPKIEITPFDGTPTKWHTFYDTFKSLVHDNESLQAVEKFHFLKNALRGDAADVVSSLSATAETYTVAWELLKQRYDKPRLIIQAHLKSLLELSEVSKDSPAHLRILLERSQLHINALRALKIDVSNWDPFLVFIITSKLDKFTRRAWERSLENDDMPSYDDLITFLKKQSRGEELNNFDKIKGNQSFQSHSKRSYAHVSTTNYQCPICSENHAIYTCDKFKALNTKARADAVRNRQLCLNCLRGNHKTIQCKSRGCSICSKKHNTMLHFEHNKSQKDCCNPNNTTQDQLQLVEPNKALMAVSPDSEVLLGTACIQILDKDNKEIECRVLLDGGSQSHFITEELAKRLGLKQHSFNIPFCGLANTITRSQYFVKAHIKSKTTNFQTDINLVALPEITGRLPSRNVDRSLIAIPHNLVLADPEFHKAKQIDALLGNTVFYNLLQIGQIKLVNKPIILQKTLFGWIITGEADILKVNKPTYPSTICLFSSKLELQLQRFWEVEEIQNKKFLSKEELDCEKHFTENIKRDQSGRYIVRLPFNENKFKLGGSFNLALKRFYSLERRLDKNEWLNKQYREFLTEYRELGHMTNITNINNFDSGYYLPHHAVFKEASSTTKVRVVFDASAKDSHNISLNEALMTGPTIQDDLISIILRFRLYKFVLTADIEKMFRQIVVDQQDVSYQKILWRDSKDEPVQIYQLNTVTYGTTCAPFLAVRCLKQLASDHSSVFPLAAEILSRDFYMDDLITGTNNYNEARVLKEQLINLLSAGGFNLRQWASNDNTLLDESSCTLQCLNLDSSSPKKILGIQWNSKNDTIFYKVKDFNSDKYLTKRTILSEIAQLFDPLGLLSPVVVKAKIIMQELWKAKINWDESVPQFIHTEWSDFKKELHLLNQLEIPRKSMSDDFTEVQLHGFCDASQQAYGACIYLRTANKAKQYETRLICSKSRVAPIKTISLPRLELCAAVLLAKLYESTLTALRFKFDSVHFWSDSTITLNWLNKPPYEWDTFVANRVAIVQNLSEISDWRHIASTDNPADFVSRGQNPSDLIHNKQWFLGPPWLAQGEGDWPTASVTIHEVPEKSNKITLLTICNSENIFTQYSSFTQLKRLVAYCLRWVDNLKSRKRTVGELSAEEIENAQLRIIKLVQSQYFQEELKALNQNKTINNKSRILTLSPFIDNEGILRVGGRLDKSKLNYASKHPIVLPKNSHVTKLIIRKEHIKNCHTGVQTTLNRVRQMFWPLDGKNITRKIIHACITCQRLKPIRPQYLMGILPEQRVTQSRPFENVGIDYCGPFLLKEKKYRNRNSIKAYVVVFVCFAIKAVHLELTTDLTTESCLAAIKRFFARRGKSKNIFTDNATNFIGAKNEINEMQNLIVSDSYNNTILHNLADDGVKWHFIPPRSPHFGGLWEAGVKSFKHHLYRIIGNSLYTYEQFNTYIIEIEGILNSRPLTPVSADPNDLSALTPNHFLINDSLSCSPEVDHQTTPDNRLSCWQQIQKMKQHFWSRWHREYLNHLNVRNKWHQGHTHNLKVGTLVTIREDNAPPMAWKLGRIIEVHPGNDNIIRVATVKTSTGIYKRAIKNLSPLPIETSEISAV